MTQTDTDEVLRVASTIRARHLSAEEAAALDHDLSEAEFALAVEIAQRPDAHPRRGEAGAWAWRGETCVTRPPGRRSRRLVG